MKSFAIALPALLAGCVGSPAVESTAAFSASPASICNEQLPDGVTVSVAAQYLSDRRHLPWLVPKLCAAQSFVPTLPAKMDGSYGELAIERFNIISGPRIDVFDIDAEGHFDGNLDGRRIFRITSMKRVARLADQN